MKIRRARATDKRAVRAMLARVWSDDYILDVFDDWVRDRRGGLWVATEDGEIVGIAKLTLLGEREAWLHGLRVDPGHRRRGIATALVEHRLRRAKRMGARIVRLDTHAVAVRRISRSHRMRVVGRYRWFTHPARAGVAPRLARPDETDALWRLALRGDGLIHLPHSYRAVVRADVARAIRLGLCVVADGGGRPGAMAILAIDRHGLSVAHLGGSGRPVTSLLRALPAEARRRRRAEVGLAVHATFWRALRSAGYRAWADETMEIFEGRL